MPQSGDNNLTVVSELFTNYLNGDSSDVIATGKSTLQTDGTAISWLSQGLEALQLHVPFVSLSGAISPIKSIDIGDLALEFAEETPWAPSAQSQTVQASLRMCSCNKRQVNFLKTFPLHLQNCRLVSL